MENFNPFVYIADTAIRQKQVAYLFHKQSMPIQEISRITKYAESTVRTYAYKFYESDIELFFEANKPVIDHVRTCCRYGYYVNMEYLQGCGEDVENTPMIYFFKFYWENTLICCKIGKTERSIHDRLVEEIAGYIKKNDWEIDRVEIHKIIPTYNIRPRFVEDYIRSGLGMEYSEYFNDNDRFMRVDIPAERFTELATEYLRKCGVM